MHPILGKNFGVREEIDLIDYSVTPNRLYKYLLTYCDHSIKIANAQPLTNKHLITIACALLSIFGATGPLDIL